jgi:hypothetical protein
VTSRAWWAAAAACILPLLHACGGGSDDNGGGAGAVRLVNATSDYASLDLYSSSTSTTPFATGVASDAASDYVSIGSGTYTMALKRTGSSTTSNTSSRSVGGSVSYTLVAYSTGEALKSAFLEESEAAPGAGSAKVRVFNASIEAGAVDVYVTAPDTLLSAVSPTAQGLGTERITGYSQFGAGTYRIRVTGTGNKADLRLDIPSVTLTDQQIATVVLTSTPGGVLVHGLTINQKGTVTAQRNTATRVRLAASAAAGGTVGATVNGTVLTAGFQSPTVGNYALVPAGAATFAVTINGTPVSAPPTTFAAGSDNTLLVTGTAGAPAVTVLSDDNRPALAATAAKIRLVHGVSGLASPITLTADFNAVAVDVAPNGASTPVSITANSSAEIEVTSPGVTGSLYLKNDFNMQAGKVYTIFMIGDTTTPVGVPRQDR